MQGRYETPYVGAVQSAPCCGGMPMNIVGVIVFSENGLPESICSSGCEKNFTVHAACGVMIDEFLGEIPRSSKTAAKEVCVPWIERSYSRGPR